MEASLDFLTSILDEIALEGLEGITLSTLWVRLENRPHFPLSLDDGSKSFIWECIAVHKDIEMYQLPKPRPALKLHDRYQHIDPEFGLVTEPTVKPDDIYPLNIIEDGNVRGSCLTYSTRTRVTSHIRHGTVLLMSLNQTIEKWPDSIVLVSSPKSRLLALLGTEANPLVELTKEQYCLLERIGRARYHGEVSQGESGLLSLSVPSLRDHLHYHSTKLVKKGLITKQKHILRTKGGKTVSGSLFHLTRFYVQRKVKFDALLECMYNTLKTKPGNREVSKTLQDEMGLPIATFRKLLKRFAQKWFKLALVPHREMYPDASAEEYLLKNGQEKQVKVIQMIRPYIEEEENFEDEEENNINPYFDPNKVQLDKPLLYQVYKFIEDAGPNGVTLTEVRNALTLPKLDIRTLCRQLVKKNEVITVMQDRGRQRFEKFISKKFESESATFINIKEQSHKFSCEEMEEKQDLVKITVINSHEKEDNVTHACDTDKGNEAEESQHDKSRDFQNIQSEVIELANGQTLAPKNTSARMPSFMAAVNSVIEGGDRHISGRLLKRANLLIAFIKHTKLTTVSELSKVITAEEKKEGYNYKVDKKSILRLIHRLCTDRRAKVMKTILKLGDTVKELEFICHPSLEPSDIEFKTAIEQAKFKYFCISKNSNKGGSGGNSKKIDEVSDKKAKTETATEVLNKENNYQKQYAPSIAKQVYGLQPKFTRTKALHLFLFYLVHDYEGANVEQDGVFAYHQSDTWKRFIPPLPNYKKKGWCILSDAISRLPLSVFVKIINFKYEIQHLESVLKDLTQQHYLVKYLPQHLRNSLLGSRRYIFMIYEILCRLCHMGLVSFGPKLHFEKDQVYIFVHRRAQIKDTSISPPGYIQIDNSIMYETREYNFQSLNDVENYWIDLETTCLHTPLGKYSVVAGQKITILDPNQKPELMDTLKNKEFDDVVDTGVPPGDCLGAAGLDSSLYSHVRRNWVWHTLSYKSPLPLQKCNVGSKGGNSTLRYLLEEGSKKPGHPASRVRLQRLTKQVLVPSKKRTHSYTDIGAPPAKKIKTVKVEKKIVRTVMRKPQKPRRPLYDAKDKVAMESMNKMRVDWSAQEDSLLLLCKVTSLFLDPHFKSLVVPCTVVRDILHQKFPQLSSNKTSRACQRRLRHMLVTSEETRCSVGVFLGEAKQDTELVKEFDRIKPAKTKEEEWKSMFVTLLDKLLEKFTSSDNENKVVSLPETISVLKSKYNIVYPANVMYTYQHYQEPESELDVYNAVISSIILSSLSSMKDTENWSYTLYKIYEQYPESMLRVAIEQLYKKHLITKKNSCKCPKFNKGSKHLTSVPYRFSVTYENAFLTKYPLKIHIEAGEILNKLKTDEVQLEGDIPAGYITVIIASVLCNKISMYTEIPEQIIVFDVALTDEQHSTIVEEIMPSLNEEESHELVKLLNAAKIPSQENEVESCKQKAKRHKPDVKNDTSVNASAMTHSSSSITMKVTKNEDCSVDLPNLSRSRLAFYMLRDALSKPKTESSVVHPQDFISVNPCDLHCKVTSDSSDTLPVIVPSNLAEIIEKPCQNGCCSNSAISSKTTNEIIDGIVLDHSYYVPSEILVEMNHAEVLRGVYKTQAKSSVVLHEGQDIFETICSSKYLGVSHMNLWKKYKVLKGEISFLSHLSILLKSKLVLRVGVADYRYVGVMHSRPWLLSSFIVSKDIVGETEKRSDVTNIIINEPVKQVGKKSDCASVVVSVNESTGMSSSCSKNNDSVTGTSCNSQVTLSSNNILKDLLTDDVHLSHNNSLETYTVKEGSDKLRDSLLKPVLFVPRTWKKPDGSLNNSVFIQLLRSVLCYVMSVPGVTEDNICKRFSLPLQPIETLELLEVLEKMFCIFRYYCKPSKRGTLFSQCSRQIITLNPEPGDIAHYESSADAVVKLAKLSDAILPSKN